MSGFFNPFRAPVSRARQTRRSPRYALESLESRLSPSDLGLTTVDVSTVSTVTSTSTDILPSDVLTSNVATLDPIDLPDGDGTPPYTPPDSDGGPAGPA